MHLHFHSSGGMHLGACIRGHAKRRPDPSRTHLDGLPEVLLHHATDALRHVGHLAEVELVVELDGRGEEVVHHVAVELNGGVDQLGGHLGDVGVKGAHVTVDHLCGVCVEYVWSMCGVSHGVGQWYQG